MDTLQRHFDFKHQAFSILETAQHMRVSRAMIYKLAKAGKLKITKLGSRSLVTGLEIERVMAESAND